ncbi:MAG: toprim domain-containing protein [Balneolaceae bacterium]|nr:toprim domain-containing protein [Balneolaceae bacterium]
MKSLVIVESPTKIKTLKKYLPKDYVIDSSMGHIRDLPASAKEIPAKYKKEEWANLGVNTDKNFEPLYVIPRGKKKVVKQLKSLLKDADELVLATDEDREGEAISWHLVEILNPDIPVKRMVFREITKEAIQDALKNFRDIDMNLVNAQETRRIIDRLAGYTISPLLWKKIAPGLSAGRVQSVAVRFLVERERERMKFRSARYWDSRQN